MKNGTFNFNWKNINLAPGQLSNMKISLSLSLSPPPALPPSFHPQHTSHMATYFQWSKNTTTSCNDLTILHMQWDCWKYLLDGTTREDLLTKFSIQQHRLKVNITYIITEISPKKYFVNIKGSLVHHQIKKKKIIEHLIFVACQILQLDLMPVSEDYICQGSAVFWFLVLYHSWIWKWFMERFV